MTIQGLREEMCSLNVNLSCVALSVKFCLLKVKGSRGVGPSIQIGFWGQAFSHEMVILSFGLSFLSVGPSAERILSVNASWTMLMDTVCF